ncbi:MAG TPA: PTS sugar transporter subunit IIB [Candidatus Limicola stercorigallinarum]|nr:PTS sugar transporter subunit IIB [Candidatus Limicola stercorigallinarum]
MDNLYILLCCGAGMSSGFLAQQMRKAAKKRGISARIEARSQNDLSKALPDADILLIGPHLAYAQEDLEGICAPYGVPVRVIPKKMYGGLDGEGLLDLAISVIEEA